MFLGEGQHTLDEKGRTTIPAKFKEKLGANPYIAYGDGCVLVFPNTVAAKFIDKLERLAEEVDIFDDELAELCSRLLAGTHCEEDAKGRIVIPQLLIEHAGMTKNLVTTTGGNHLQIWDEDRLKAKRAIPKVFSEALKSLKNRD